MRKLFPLFAFAFCAAAGAAPNNPFYTDWKTPFGVPPFKEIKEDHYLPAFKEGMARRRKEVAAIVNRRSAPTFENTVAALDASGELLGKVGSVFFNLASAETNDRLQAIEKEVAPLLARHQDDISLDPRLFKRVRAVWDGRDKAALKPDQQRLLEYTYQGFVRNGALLNAEQQKALRAINEELSVLSVQFSENVLKETNAFELVIDKPEDLAGLPAGYVAAAAEAARQAGKPGKWLITLHAPSIWPFLQYSQQRDLRRQVLQAYLSRGDHGDARDNKAIIARVAALRVDKAKLLGYANWADYVLEQTMAKNAKGVYGLLDRVWDPALAVAKREAADLQAVIDGEKGGFKLESWDWRYYAEKLKQSRFALDEEALRPYFPLEQVREGAFRVAEKLYGLRFKPRADIPVYHADVKASEVLEKDGRHVGLFLVDYHPRPGKRGGAWCSGFRYAWIKNGQRVDPVIANVGNFSRPAEGKPALLNIEEVETLFHEFGHALHALLYAGRFRNGNMPPDFVELPSQVLENWALEPEVLKTYARHWQTGEAMPDALIAKIRATRHFNQGFETVEYMAASRLDMDWHTLTDNRPVDTTAFENASIARMGLIREIPLRYRSTYFTHIVGGYDAGYYGYLWSGVLDSDAFAAFKEKGDLFDPATAASFRKNILEPGFGREPGEMYRAFRGRDPIVEPLLKRRGLL